MFAVASVGERCGERHQEVAMTALIPALADFTGQLLAPGDDGFDTARRVWNGAIDRTPAFIARCRCTGDVVAALRFGRRHGLPVAVRGGGHSIPGHCVCEGGLMIDLQPMKGIAVDARRRLADVGPGVLWQELDAATQRHGLATPGGEVSDTGVAGLTLGGGIGWLSRRYGLAADNLLAVELVTADGQVVTVDDAADPELMWGLRGGGGNFGIVTRFRFRLHPVGPLWGGLVLYPGERAAEVLAAAVALGDDAPRELGLVAAVISAPPAPFVPPEQVGRPVAGIAAAYLGDPGDGPDVLAPLRGLGAPLADTFGVMRYVDLQRMFDDGTPAGLQYYVKSDFLTGLNPDALDRLATHGSTPSSPRNQMLLRHLGGRIADIDPAATAFATRDAQHMLLLAGAWTDPTDDPTPHRDWVRGAWEAVRPWAHGTYVNHLGDEGTARLREAYPPTTWRRLTALKRRMDPANVFAHNQNIPPQA
jgi:FAD/FMN-containing dehydrogenase